MGHSSGRFATRKKWARCCSGFQLSLCSIRMLRCWARGTPRSIPFTKYRVDDGGWSPPHHIRATPQSFVHACQVAVSTISFFGHGPAHAVHGVCGLRTHLLSRRSVSRTATRSDHSRARGGLFLLDPFAPHTNLPSLGRSRGPPSSPRYCRLPLGMSHGYPRRFGSHRFARQGSGPGGRRSQIFLHNPHYGHTDFCNAHSFAFRARSNPQAHKRLILVATIARMIAAIARWPLVISQGKTPMASLFSYIFLLIPGGLRPLVHTQSSSRYTLGEFFPHLRATDKDTHRQERRLARLRQVCANPGPLTRCKCRLSKSVRR